MGYSLSCELAVDLPFDRLLCHCSHDVITGLSTKATFLAQISHLLWHAYFKVGPVLYQFDGYG